MLFYVVCMEGVRKGDREREGRERVDEREEIGEKGEREEGKWREGRGEGERE
jgi:hypothetical protein